LVGTKHLASVEIGGTQEIEVDAFQPAVPARRIAVGPAAGEEVQQPEAAAIAMVIESDDAVGDEDVVARALSDLTESSGR
jgi:hypothetical protein